MRHLFSLEHWLVLFIVISFPIVSIASLHSVPQPKYEMRAVWLTTIGGLDWPHSYASTPSSILQQKRELCDILDSLVKANVNTVLLQTRIRGTVIYPSVYEPWDGCLSGKPGVSPKYDPLRFAIEECHKRGLELHAWVVTIPAGQWNKLGCIKLRERYPNMVKRKGKEGFLDPEYKGTAQYLTNICNEIASNYDIDGIHLDYLRYPENWNRMPSADQGRRYITKIIRSIYHSVKRIKPWIKISCSPIGKYKDLSRYSSYGWNAYSRVLQDAQSWLDEGIVDIVYPMMYFQANQFFPFAIDWKEHSHDRIISVGLGIYLLSEHEKDWNLNIIKRQMNVLRDYMIGHTYFRSKFLTDNIKGIYDFIRNNMDLYPALIPPISWQSSKLPLAPTKISVNRRDKQDLLSWSSSTNAQTESYIRYNVYGSTHYPVDISDVSNLLAVNFRDTVICIPIDNKCEYMNYAVTTIDRFGNESFPIYTSPISSRQDLYRFIDNNGYELTLPPKRPSLDADCIVIENIQGGIMYSGPYVDSVNISVLPKGCYVIKSLNHKGITHRIGWFFLTR